MHILRPQFRIEDERALAFAAARGFGVVVAADARGPRASHVPFVLERREGAPVVEIHLTARNPLVELVVHFRGDVSAGSVFSLTLYGVSRNYLSHSSPSTAGLPSVNGVNMIPAILWQ